MQEAMDATRCARASGNILDTHRKLSLKYPPAETIRHSFIGWPSVYSLAMQALDLPPALFCYHSDEAI